MELSNQQLLEFKNTIENRGEASVDSILKEYAKKLGYSQGYISNMYYSFKKTQFWAELGTEETNNVPVQYVLEKPQGKFTITIEAGV